MLKATELNLYIKEAIFPMLENHGFTKWEANRHGVTCVKITPTARYTLSYGIGTYDYYQLGGIGACVIFPTLEKLVMPSLEKSQLMGKGSIKSYCTNRNWDTQFETHFGKAAVLKDFKDLDAVIEIYKKSIIECYIPYFDTFNNLNDFYHFMQAEQDPDPDRLVELLSTIFYEFKLMALYRLCNDARYDDYINSYYDRCKKESEIQPVDPYTQQYWVAIQHLKPILDKTKPLFNL